MKPKQKNKELDEMTEGLFKIIDLSMLRTLYKQGTINFPEYVRETCKIAEPKITLLTYTKGIEK